nr:MAG: major capsid protein [Microvirus sp.]
MKRSKFSLSYYKLLSMRMGELVPMGLTEVLPGDTVQQATSMLVRASPLLAPVMHPVHMRIHHWFVPHRLVWEDWEDFITGGPDGMDASVFPTITFGGGTGAAVGSLADYLGVTPLVNNLEVSALPFRGYALIFNEWYRDQDLQSELTVDLGSGPDTTTSTALQNVNWEKDYFTTSRPWEQKGPQVSIPLTGNAPVTGIGVYGTNTSTNNQAVRETDGSNPTYSGMLPTNSSNQIAVELAAQVAGGAGRPAVYADLSAVSGVTINALREALALQRFEEARARYGSRYVEYLRYLGVKSSDARLQIPEYLGGGKQTLQFSEVLQTAPVAANGVVGDLKGHGIGAMRSNRFRRFFEEHGYVFSFVSVKPKTMYVQGVHRTWNRRIKEDFFQKELQHIGQQEVLNKELYAAHTTPDGTFGYQDRYDEYRRSESGVAGEFRTSTLNYWHLARTFSSDPALNSTFVSSVPTERVFAASTNDTLYVMAMHSIQARRLLTKRGTSFTF